MKQIVLHFLLIMIYIFSSLIGKKDSTFYKGKAYYPVSNKDIENINKTFDYVPSRLVFLEKEMDFNINYIKKKDSTKN